MQKRSSDEQVSPMREAMIALHEVFTELKAVGFSRKDALNIIGFMIVYGMTDSSEEE